LRSLVAGLLGLLLLWAAPAHAQASIPVTLADGRYVAVPPPGWDGKTPLPLLLYVHGYGDDPEKLLADAPLIQAMNQARVLAILPAGEDGAWSFRGSPHQGRDDLAFLHEVVADARRRWPVDPKHVIAGGFSIGASMVWDLACHSPQGFTAFLPFSGTFWVPYPDHCDGGPVNLRQVHGTDDHTFPMWGRPIGLLWRQGDTRKGFEILKQLDACPAEPAHEPAPDGLDCEVWTGCAGGTQLRLCLHTGDHYVNPAWLASGLAWALTLPAS
jgi:polyhydroxybutyrate depolymerase